MKKFVYISIFPVPYNVKYCYLLQKYFDTEFWFYIDIFQKDSYRPEWWKVDIGDKCKILKNVFFINSRKFFTLNIITELNRFDPDIIMLGGFTIPSNYFAYLWGKRHNKKVIIFTERVRTNKGELKKNNLFRRFIKMLYRNIDMVIVPSEDTIAQFKDVFGYKEKVVLGNYPIDLEKYFAHNYRTKKDFYTYLFPNRLIEIYNPLLAIDIFYEIQKKYHDSKLLINSEGNLLTKCKELIKKYNLENNVEFLSEIKSWEELHLVYKRADIMILPALFSNGNISISEAMASGLGIVISNKIMGRSGAFITNGYNGFKCNPTKEEFVECIENYIKNPSLFVEHANINRLKVKPYSIEETAVRFNDLVKNHFNN